MEVRCEVRLDRITELMRRRFTMKFYEFNTKDYEYYALIGAETVEQGKNLYKTAADIEYPADDNVMPDEISEVKARERRRR